MTRPLVKGQSTIKPVDLVVDEVPPQARRAAARLVASQARDAADCAELLAALGLSPEEGLAEEPCP